MPHCVKTDSLHGASVVVVVAHPEDSSDVAIKVVCFRKVVNKDILQISGHCLICLVINKERLHHVNK